MPLPKPRASESRDEFLSRCMEEATEYNDTDQRYAVCVSKYDEKAETKQTYSDYPEAAKDNAQRALDIREETGNPNDCGTRVGWERANQLASGEALSLDTVERMAQFNRHRDNSDGDPKEDCGALMWLAWGGDEGIDWALRISERENEKSMNNTVEVGELYSYKQPDETKQFNFVIKDQHLDEVNKTATIEGYGAIFGNVDLGNDMIQRGAFAKTLKDKGNKVYFLADHQYNTENILGVATVEEDDIGLLGKFEINLETQKGREAYSQAKQMQRHGLPLGLSIGFDIMEDDMDQKTQVRLLKQIRLHEISLTPFPMNQEARVTTAKSQNKELAVMQELLDSLKSLRPSNDISTERAEATTIIENLIKSLNDERTKQGS